MSLAGELQFAGSRHRTDLPLSRKGFAEALDHAEAQVASHGGRTIISFFDIAAALRQAFDPAYRSHLASRMLLPCGGRGVRVLAHLMGFQKPSVAFSAETFVSSLLTLMDRSRRIAIVGTDVSRLESLKAHFSRHAPWHEFVAISADELEGDRIFPAKSRQRLDMVIVETSSYADEHRIERYLAAVQTGLVVMTGGQLSRIVAS